MRPEEIREACGHAVDRHGTVDGELLLRALMASDPRTFWSHLRTLIADADSHETAAYLYAPAVEALISEAPEA